MASIVEFKVRELDPNLNRPVITIPIEPTRYLVASLKGAKRLNIVKLGNQVELEGIMGVETFGTTFGRTVLVDIYRGASSANGGTLIYQGVFGTADSDLHQYQVAVSHVDTPTAIGPVTYYLEVTARMGLTGTARLFNPVTFKGTQIDPTG